jgi:ribonuclease P protein component
MMISFTFKKSERLCSQKIIGELFLSGKSFMCYPLKVVWIETALYNTPYHAQVAFSVPKKTFKKAHDRNSIKRKLRESYRFHKSSFYVFLEQNGKQIAMMILFISKEDQDFRKIDASMVKILDHLQHKLLSEQIRSVT